MALTKQDLQEISVLLKPLQNDIQDLKQDMQGMKQNIQGLSQRLTSLELHVENQTDRNIQLLAENHLEIMSKLDTIVSFQRKDLIFEVEISDLKSRVTRLEEKNA